MGRALFAKSFGVFVVAIPVALFARSIAMRQLAQIATDPSGFLAHERKLQHPGFLHHFILWIIVVGLLVLAVEGVSHLGLRATDVKRM